MENSKIEWTNHTFNPWIGCTKVSPGCLHCYAETLMDTRYARVKWGAGNPRARTSNSNWSSPLKWNREAEGISDRPRVFCASLADWLDNEVPVEWLADLVELISQTPNLDWLLLTKRPENFQSRMLAVAMMKEHPASKIATDWSSLKKALPNVWLGTTAEDQTRWDQRLPLLRDIPANVRFVSAEPLIGMIIMGEIRPDWLIVGGESGLGARPMAPEWVKQLRDQCDHRTAFHFKQWGGINKKLSGRKLDGRTWNKLPIVSRLK